MPWFKRKITVSLFILILFSPTSYSHQLSGHRLLNQCQSLLEGSQSLMGAFQSGQCSSYILGIYDVISEQCPSLKIARGEVVKATLVYLQQAQNKHKPAVILIDQFLSRQNRCLPIASTY